ncbi:Protein of unknown function, partial [Gryllus bimaculatus]
SNKCVSR